MPKSECESLLAAKLAFGRFSKESRSLLVRAVRFLAAKNSCAAGAQAKVNGPRSLG